MKPKSCKKYVLCCIAMISSFGQGQDVRTLLESTVKIEAKTRTDNSCIGLGFIIFNEGLLWTSNLKIVGPGKAFDQLQQAKETLAGANRRLKASEDAKNQTGTKYEAELLRSWHQSIESEIEGETGLVVYLSKICSEWVNAEYLVNFQVDGNSILVSDTFVGKRSNDVMNSPGFTKSKQAVMLSNSAAKLGEMVSLCQLKLSDEKISVCQRKVVELEMQGTNLVYKVERSSSNEQLLSGIEYIRVGSCIFSQKGEAVGVAINNEGDFISLKDVNLAELRQVPLPISKEVKTSEIDLVSIVGNRKTYVVRTGIGNPEVTFDTTMLIGQKPSESSIYLLASIDNAGPTGHFKLGDVAVTQLLGLLKAYVSGDADEWRKTNESSHAWKLCETTDGGIVNIDYSTEKSGKFKGDIFIHSRTLKRRLKRADVVEWIEYIERYLQLSSFYKKIHQ